MKSAIEFGGKALQLARVFPRSLYRGARDRRLFEQIDAAHLVAHGDHMVGGRTINALPDNPYATASQEIIDVVYRYYNAEAGPARFFTSNNLALSAERFRAIGGFDPAFTTSEDRELCDRWLHHGGALAYAPAPGSSMRIP